jgi:hypothetical protein
MASDGPPAENGTMMVMGREGKLLGNGGADEGKSSKYGQHQPSHDVLPQGSHHRHCEERSDEAIHLSSRGEVDFFARNDDR